MALSDDDVTSALDYLGQKQPAPTSRLTSLPSAAAGGGAVAPPITGGTSGTSTGVGQSPVATEAMGMRGRPQGAGGPSALATAASAANVAGKATDFASRFMGDDLTRGTIGGEGTPQDANASLSDTLRSGAAGLPGTLAMPPGVTPPDLQALGATGSEIAGATPGAGIAGAGGGAGSLAGGIGTGAAGAGLVAAALGLLAEQTGNKDLGTATKALGAGAGAASLAGTGASLAATGGTLAAEGATAGIGAAAGAAFAPITAMMLASTISGLVGGEDPVGEGMAEIMAGTPHFQDFVSGKLMPNERTQGVAFDAFQKALPYVQSQAQLQDLIGTMRKYVTTNTGIASSETDPFTLSSIPGVGSRTHGQATDPIDWTGRTKGLQSVVTALRGKLPAQADGGTPTDQLWNQFVTQGVDPAQAPYMVKMPDGSTQYMTPSDYQNSYNQTAEQAIAAGGAPPEYMANVTQYGQPGYDYAGGGLLAPGATPGEPSSTWTALVKQIQDAQAAQDPGVATAPAAVPDSVAGRRAPPLTFQGQEGALGFAQDVTNA